MKHTLTLLALLTSASLVGAQDKKPAEGGAQLVASGLTKPESAAVGFGGRIFVTEIGVFEKDGDGQVAELKDGKFVPFVKGLDDPKGMVVFQKHMFVNDNTRVLKIDDKGKVEVFAKPEDFPIKPIFLNDIAADEKGNLAVSDSGDRKGAGGAVYLIDPKGKVTLLADAKKYPEWKIPNGVLFDGRHFLLMADFGAGTLWKINVADGKAEKLVDGGYEGADGLAFDHFGRLYMTSNKLAKIWVRPRPEDKFVEIPTNLESAADCCLSPDGKHILVPDMKAGKLMKVAIGVPQQPVDDSPLPIATEVAFPKLKWAQWEGVGDDGKVREHRPNFLTHANDGSNRVFVGLQTGPIHVFPNDPSATETKIFLDLTSKVLYESKENEQGLLGMAFHPNFKSNGEFFVFYSLKGAKLTNVVSRFKVKKDNPNEADLGSEEVLLKIERPFWNHDGGTLVFGPDGYLYIAVGDGGKADDPHRNAQNLGTILGSILRIDVDKKDPGLAYAIPKDNPFVGVKDARGEIWAYGFRNPWRISFDPKTKKLWAGDVGQNLWEEINIVEKGGNYGWAKREGLHPFNPEGVEPNSKMIEPIWEYHHDIGKSITGGNVYRGKRVPELEGAYIYGDYVTSKIWALRYDDEKKRVVANRPIQDMNKVIFSFGDDGQGEIYLLAPSLNGEGIYRFVKTKS